jgi:hypothetical protein
MNLWTTQQFEMSRLVGDPLVGLREAERAPGVLVPSECAIQRHEAIAHQSFGKEAPP